MTSASELFYQRRSRIGRASTSATDLEFESDRNFHLNYSRRHHHYHNGRHDLDDHLQRSNVRHHPCHRLSSHPDRPSVRLDQGTSQLTPSNSISTETLSNASISTETLSNARRPRLTATDRLPGTVLLARARLLERLRGVSLSGNRRSGGASFGIYNREFTFGDDLRVVDVGDWETDIPPRSGFFARGTPFTDSTYTADGLQSTRDSSKRKPPGLSLEDLKCLQLEIFSSLEKGTEGEVSQVSWDCSICLESFQDGEKLIRLPCNHRFHSSCLDPWVRTCGDCPYCRRDIVVSSYKS